MSADYILRRFAQDTGVNCYTSTTTTNDDQQYAFDLLNESAKDFWLSRDLTNSLAECVLVCLDNKQISLPPFIGQLRAIRELDSFIPWRLSDIRPRYFKNSWADDAIRNWREKGKKCYARDITNTAPPKVIVPFVEQPNIQVTIIGQTKDAQRISETVVVTDTTVQFQSSFVEYLIIKKNRSNDCDVLIQDADNLDLTIIYNEDIETWWNYVDAGQYFSNPQPFPIECLFKPKFKIFYALEDEFQLPGYDDVLIQCMISLWESRKKNTQASMDALTLANQKADRIGGDKQKGVDHRIEFQQTGHDGIFQGLKGFNTLR